MRVLKDVIQWVQNARAEDLSMMTICVREPWSASSEARVVPLDEESRLPPDALDGGFKYFLEASLAQEVLEALRDRPTQSTAEDSCRLLIHYAENDAYPDWVYQ